MQIQTWRMTGEFSIQNCRNKMIAKSLIYVLFPLILTFLVTWLRLLDRAKVELGLEHYAEKGDPNSFLKMPANALVNIGYALVGIYWIRRTKLRDKKLGEETFFYYIFGWMSVFYGGVQFSRIVSQTRLFAIMDQWVTLPFFAWVVCWNEFLYRHLLWQSSRFTFYMRVSWSSYFLVLLHDFGFEMTLGIHILAAIVFTIRTQTSLGSKTSLVYFWLALLCCTGFVFLKLGDHRLGQFSIFLTFSGHFWSKICDIAQVHCVFRYFESLRLVDRKPKGLDGKNKKKLLTAMQADVN